MEEIEKQIAIGKKLLRSYEKGDYEERKWDKDLKELRHFAIYIHSTIENYMMFVISKHLFPKFKPKDKNQEAEILTEEIVFNNKVTFFLDEMEFFNKTKVLEKFKLLPGNVLSQIRGVNTIRVRFSHPSAYMQDLLKYKDRKSYNDALWSLLKALEATTSYILKHYPDFGKGE